MIFKFSNITIVTKRIEGIEIIFQFCIGTVIDDGTSSLKFFFKELLKIKKINIIKKNKRTCSIIDLNSYIKLKYDFNSLIFFCYNSLSLKKILKNNSK